MLVEHKKPKMQILRREKSSEAKGIVIVIDVLGAFTTAAYALGSGAEKIILVSAIDEAKKLAKTLPDVLTVGEEKGLPIPGFDFDNSPWSFSGHDLTGKTLVLRISCGTQGLAHGNQYDRILAASFVVAEATLSRIHALAPKELTFLAMGMDDESENIACAEYLEARLNGDFEGPVAPFLRKAASSPAAQLAQQHHDDYPLSDLDAALALDAFPFAMEIFKEESLLALQAVKPNGTSWQ